MSDVLEIPLRDFPAFVRRELWEQSDRSEIGPLVTVECWSYQHEYEVKE